MKTLQPLVVKEIQSLMPAWFAGLMAILLGTLVDGLGGITFRLSAYILAAAALGAWSIGQEYSHRTLALLLTQPVGRRRILAVKLAVLAVSLLLLFVLAAGPLYGGHVSPYTTGALDDRARMLLFLPALAGLCLAPWLTMLCRAPLPGTVFTIAMPAVLWISGELVGVAKYGFIERTAYQLEILKLSVMAWTLPVLCTVGAVMTWRTFMRLEVSDGPGREIALAFPTAAGSRAGEPAPSLITHAPVRLLVEKELRLQQMTLAVAGLYALFVLAVLGIRHLLPAFLGPTLSVVTVFYGLLLSVLAGALASAEERQFGTHDWQLLLPMATSRQWAVKTVVAVGLTIALAGGLPALLSLVEASGAVDRILPGQFVVTVVALVVLTLGSLYVSSLSSSGIRALLTAIPALLAAAVLFVLVDGAVRPAISSSAFFYARALIGEKELRTDVPALVRAGTALQLSCVAGLSLLLMSFARANHRSADLGGRRVRSQAIWIAAGLVTASVLMAAMQGVLSARF